MKGRAHPASCLKQEARPREERTSATLLGVFSAGSSPVASKLCHHISDINRQAGFYFGLRYCEAEIQGY